MKLTANSKIYPISRNFAIIQYFGKLICVQCRESPGKKPDLDTCNAYLFIDTVDLNNDIFLISVISFQLRKSGKN